VSGDTKGGYARRRRSWKLAAHPDPVGASVTNWKEADDQMAFLRRMSTVVRAKISRLLDRFERPGEILDYGYQKQVENLYNLKRGIAGVVTAKRRVQRQQATLQQKVVKLDTQARQALATGQEDLARTALERKQLAQGELQSLDRHVGELEDQQQKLIDFEQKLRVKVETFRTRKEVVKAQHSAAEAQVRISEAATGVGSQMADVGMALQRAIDKTESLQARASAVQELEAAGTFDDLTALGSGKDDIDRQLDEIGALSAVDDELARIKIELGPMAPSAQIPAHSHAPLAGDSPRTAGQ
jgi:phage shock protein A